MPNTQDYLSNRPTTDQRWEHATAHTQEMEATGAPYPQEANAPKVTPYFVDTAAYTQSSIQSYNNSSDSDIHSKGEKGRKEGKSVSGSGADEIHSGISFEAGNIESFFNWLSQQHDDSLKQIKKKRSQRAPESNWIHQAWDYVTSWWKGKDDSKVGQGPVISQRRREELRRLLNRIRDGSHEEWTDAQLKNFEKLIFQAKDEYRKSLVESAILNKDHIERLREMEREIHKKRMQAYDDMIKSDKHSHVVTNLEIATAVISTTAAISILLAVGVPSGPAGWALIGACAVAAACTADKVTGSHVHKLLAKGGSKGLMGLHKLDKKHGSHVSDSTLIKGIAKGMEKAGIEELREEDLAIAIGAFLALIDVAALTGVGIYTGGAAFTAIPEGFTSGVRSYSDYQQKSITGTQVLLDQEKRSTSMKRNNAKDNQREYLEKIPDHSLEKGILDEVTLLIQELARH